MSACQILRVLFVSKHARLISRQLCFERFMSSSFTLQQLGGRNPKSHAPGFMPQSHGNIRKLKHRTSDLSMALPNPKSCFSSSSTQNTQIISESETKVPLRKGEKGLMKNPIRNERLENQNIFRQMIVDKGDTPWTGEGWDSTAEILSQRSRVKWEVVCMHTLYLDKNLLLGKSLMEYLEAQEEASDIVTLTFFIGLLGETSSGSEAQEEKTKIYFDTLLSRTDFLDAASIEILVSGLSHTKYYPECLKLLDICKESSTPGPGILINILKAGLRNRNNEICAMMLSQIEEMHEPTSFNAFAAKVIDECLAVKNENGLQMVMDFMQKHRLLLSRKVLDEIKDSFYSHQAGQWRAKYGYIHHKGGNCVVCGHQMPKTEISDNEFKSVQTAFLDQVIVGHNIFYKTTPKEAEHFVQFIKKTGPFDVIIDGLNVIHKGPRPPQKERLERAVKYFLSENKKVLILGSIALKRFLPHWKGMTHKPDVYLTSTTKADDVFFLYAALHSGKNALIVSHDKLRDHKFLLQPNLRHIFLHWLRSAQIYDWFFSRSNEFTIRRRSIFNIGPVKDDGGWHIPEMDEDVADPFGKFTVLCLRDKTKQTVVSENYADKSSNINEKRKPSRDHTGKGKHYQKKINSDVEKEWFES